MATLLFSEARLYKKMVREPGQLDTAGMTSCAINSRASKSA
jgi:hypothetical protein